MRNNKDDIYDKFIQICILTFSTTFLIDYPIGL